MKVKHTKFISYHPLHLWSETNAVLHQLASLWFRLYHLVLAVQFALQSDEFQTEDGFDAVPCVACEISSHTFETVYVCFCN